MAGESDNFFNRLQFFCSLGPGRSLPEVARHFRIAVNTIRNGSYEWRWLDRASAWDDEQARRKAAAALTESENLAREHARRWKLIGDLALEAFEKVSPDHLSVKDALAMADRATHYQRLAVGEATERVETRTVLDTSRLTTEELVELRRLLRKARGE